MVEQYFEKEELQKNFEGIEEEKAKQTAKELTYLEMKYFFENGDIYIYDDNITAAIIGIEHKKISMIKMLPSVFKINKILSKKREPIIQWVLAFSCNITDIKSL